MEMLLIRYYNINRFLLSFIGLWPFQNKIVQQIQNFFFYALLISAILVQIFKLISSETSFELYINVSTYAIVTIAYTSRYITFLSQLENIKHLVTRLFNNWNLLVDEKDYEIMDKYALKGKKITFVVLSMKQNWAIDRVNEFNKNFFLLVLTCTLIFALILWTSWLFVLDNIAPLNGSHHLQPPFLAEYFVDEEVYFHYILIHMYMIMLLGMLVAIATETFYATCVTHACGLFYMAGYHFEKAFEGVVLGLIPCTKKCTELSEKVAHAIEAHINAIEFVDHMNSCFSTCYFLLLIFAVATLIVNVIAMFQAINAHEVYDVFYYFTCVFNVMCLMFYVSYSGQKLIDSSSIISEKVYDVPWFLAPPKIRGLLLVVMQRSLKTCALVLGSVFAVSFEFYALVLKMAACYITSLRALQ